MLREPVEGTPSRPRDASSRSGTPALPVADSSRSELLPEREDRLPAEDRELGPVSRSDVDALDRARPVVPPDTSWVVPELGSLEVEVRFGVGLVADPAVVPLSWPLDTLCDPVPLDRVPRELELGDAA